MRRHNPGPGFLACLLAAAVISAGMAIPKILIESQEGNSASSLHVMHVQEKTPIAYLENTPEVIPTSPRTIDRLSAWYDRSGTMVYREPLQNELSMDAAFDAARQEMQKMADLGILPETDLPPYQLTTAELMSNSATGAARWVLKFAYNEEQVAIVMDGQTGMIYDLDLSSSHSDGISNQERLRLYARYLDLTPGDLDFSQSGDWDTLNVGGLVLQAAASRPLNDSFIVSIHSGLAE